MRRSTLALAILSACTAAHDDVRARADDLLDDPVLAGCLPPGIVSICEQPLAGSSPQATVFGGTLLPAGFRVDEKGDHVTFDFGEDLIEATIRFELTGIGPTSLAHDDVLVLLATDTPELHQPAPTRVLELRIWGSTVDPSQSGNTRVGVGDSMQEATKSAGILDYDTEHTYELELSWNDATQRLALVRDGEQLLDFHTGDQIPGPENDPIALRYRYVHVAMPYLANPGFWPVIDGVYGSFSIAATPASEGGESSDDAADETTGAAESTSTSSATTIGDDSSSTDDGAIASSSDGETSSTTDGDDIGPFPPGLGDDPPDTGCGCNGRAGGAPTLALVPALWWLRKRSRRPA
jgi:hypothetical protein